MSEFHLTIRTPEKDVFDGKVSSLSFNTELGRVQILAHHANFTTTLQFSPVKIEDPVDNRDQNFLARSGIFSFDHKKNEALLLCLFCEEQSQVSYQTTEEYLKFLTAELAKGDLSDFQVLFLKGERLAVEKQMKAVK
ncbi:MAG: F0F1 ATP synthase subunit epsilon [Candidatus Gracilibacteria bacterium]|jgi:F0F1-type ATP synthase epsilon subunit